MKRGWITWDQHELPREAFDSRLMAARQILEQRGLPLLVVYTDIWRSNQGRHFANYMPYWNRALLLLPRHEPPVLLCALSPRVYPWIKSVTVLDDIRPSPNLAGRLLEICAEKGWNKIGVLCWDQLPYDLYQQIRRGVEAVDVAMPQAPDQWELAMYRHAARLARQGLEEELPQGVGRLDHEFAGRLDGRFRRAGAEDLVVLLTNGKTAPRPAAGETLGPDYSVALALEYRGHWVKLARSASSRDPVPVRLHVENLSGPYPFEPFDRLETQSVLAVRFESQTDGVRRFHGDTYWSGSEGLQLL